VHCGVVKWVFITQKSKYNLQYNNIKIKGLLRRFLSQDLQPSGMEKVDDGDQKQVLKGRQKCAIY